MDEGLIFWCDVCSSSTVQYPELIGDHPFWACEDCLSVLGPIIHQPDGVD